MANGNNITYKEHFVPQTYLKGFSIDSKNIYFYDLNKMVESKYAVPIKSVAYKKFLYEFKNAEGELIYANVIENCLAKLEDLFSRYRDLLLRKVFIKDNYATNKIMDHDEIEFWITYIGLQILRTPEMLSTVSEVCLSELSLTKHDADNLSLMFCIPFLGDDYDRNKRVFDLIISPMCNMNICVGVIENEMELFTSDQPVYVCATDFVKDGYQEIIFPVTDKICLFLYGDDYKCAGNDNRLLPIDKELVRNIYLSISYSAKDKIFSKNKLTKEQINCIYKARADFKRDLIKGNKHGPI